uniref:Uncharacterized protein n=1 Tax=Siphoviridae sp. ctij073 TaxID=2825625 RepID=A0A8S5UAA2_9CAUD|nr:MAG TPA: hypothetical protein [Siphoviridae sp. ctij073]
MARGVSAPGLWLGVRMLRRECAGRLDGCGIRTVRPG